MEVLRNPLGQAFSQVIYMLKGPLALGDRRLAVIGGFCVQHYLGVDKRETKVFSFFLSFFFFQGAF